MLNRIWTYAARSSRVVAAFVQAVWFCRRRRAERRAHEQADRLRKAWEERARKNAQIDAELAKHFPEDKKPSLPDRVRRAGSTFHVWVMVMAMSVSAPGCKTWYDIEDAIAGAGDAVGVPDEPGTIPVVVEPTPHSEEGSQTLLIKPEADTTGNLVILLPAKWNNSFRNVWLLDHDGKRHDDNGRRNINPPPHENGNRRHVWFREPGTTYGAGWLGVEIEGRAHAYTNRVDFGTRREWQP